MNSLKRGIELGCKAWGWDLYSKQLIKNPD
jgi:hypothetical protein